MSLRLRTAALLVRGWAVMPWLRLVDRTVCGSLAELIGDQILVTPITGTRMPWGPAGFRRAMAQKHARLVTVLVERRGKEAGVSEGREVMHAAGIDLGDRLRSMLGLAGSEDDLFAAAGLLYRILGIEFLAEREGEGARLLVQRCSLSEHYGPLTCEVLSAMDEGVVEGLDPRARMTFTKRNTAPSSLCEAKLAWGPVR
jgi:hypothetical protein